MTVAGENLLHLTRNSDGILKALSPLANVKQVLVICLAVIIFDLHITRSNGMGISLTLLSGIQ